MASATRSAAVGNFPAEGGSGHRTTSRLIAGFIALTAMGVVVGFSAILFMNKIDATLSEITTVFTPTSETAEDMKMRFWESVAVAEEFLTEPDSAGIDRLAERFANLAKVYENKDERLKALVREPDYVARVSRAKAAHQHFVALVNRIIELRRQMLAQEAQIASRAAAFNQEGDALVEQLTAVAQHNSARMAEARRKGDEIAASWQFGARDLNSVLHNVFDVDFPTVDASLRLGRLVEAMRATVSRYLAEPVRARLPIQLDAFNAAAQEARTHLDTLNRLGADDERRGEVTALTERLLAWTATASAQSELLATYHDLLDARAKLVEITLGFEKEAEDLVANLRIVAVHADEVSQRADREVDRQVDLAIIFTCLIILLMMVVATRMIFNLLPQAPTPSEGSPLAEGHARSNGTAAADAQ